MAVPTVQYDETAPAGADNISQGDDRIRELKTQIREVVAVDHEFTSTQTASTGGQHKQVTLQEQADLGSGAVDATILGSQTVSGKGELVYTDEDDNDVQITDTGNVNAAALGGVYAVDNLAAIAAILEHVYPVGSVVTLGVSTNPATLLGVGTWTAIAGKVIVGISGSGTFNTLDATGGAETHTHGTSGTHTHSTDCTAGASASGCGCGTDATTSTTAANTGAAAGDSLQPYIVKYCWQRTS